MMTGNIAPDDELAYKSMKLSKAEDQTAARALFWSYDAKKGEYSLLKQHTILRDQDYEAVVTKISNDFKTSAVYIMMDFEFKQDDGRPGRKLVFLQWIPDECATKERMHYSTAATNFKTKLDPGIPTVQATDMDEISFEEVRKKLTKK